MCVSFVQAVHADGYPKVTFGIFKQAVNVFANDLASERFVFIHPEQAVCSADPVPAFGIFPETSRMLIPALQLCDEIEFVFIGIPGEDGVGYAHPYRSVDGGDAVYGGFSEA